MNDLDVLRGTLREREACAPDPDDVFAGVRRRIHRRQVRRRAAAVAVVVAVTAGGLVGGVAWWGAGHGRTDVAAPPSVTEVPAFPAKLMPPPMAVRLRHPLPGFAQTSWTISPVGEFGMLSSSSAQYEAADGRTVVLTMHRTGTAPEPAGPPVPLGDGATGRFRTVSPGGERELVVPGPPSTGWVSVLGSAGVPDQTLVQVASSLDEGAVDSIVRAVGVPTSWRIVSWSDGPQGNFITLCPEVGARQECAEVRTTTGVLPEVYDSVDLPGTGTVQSQAKPVRVPLDRRVRVDGVDLRTSADGRVAARQLDPGHWSVVRTEAGQAGIVAHVAASLLYR
ncbi:hypothetical protein [Amycolatopsis sp. CA-230715]|uniref:hypothetical protein n=1 Tax=Amycolatopsis sp. CA-230715 TaxID=2745196 RepID=UPI001C00B624|nr:hypothetical protein [Amycolatopsis sp. CA-230715]QWF77349.1 hypothetical protein HUW46_00741 [Amycolatopsis sp. CA-230715]